MDDKYLYKQLYAEKVMKSNSEIGQDNGLTEEQCDALERLCKIRHEIHCAGADVMFNAEHGSYNEMWDYLDYGINELLSDANLPTISFGFDREELPDSLTYDIPGIWDEDMTYDKAYYMVAEVVSESNSIIESYLREIDRQYGTSYCPTGFARLRG